MKLKLHFGPAGKPVGFRGDIVQAIDFLLERGLDAMEVQQVRGVVIKEETAKRIGEHVRETGFFLSLHAPYAINLSAESEDKIKRSQERLVKAARIAYLMNVRGPVVFHPGYYGKREKEEAVRLVIKSLSEVVEQLRSQGVKVLLGVETTGKMKQVGSFEEVLRIVREVPMTIPVLDFAHIHARTGGSLKDKESYAKIFSRIESELGREYLRYVHIHFTEVEFSVTSGEKRHLPLGSGLGPAFEPLIETLVEFGVEEATIISESPLLDQDALKMKQIASKVVSCMSSRGGS